MIHISASAVVPEMLRAVEGVTKELWGDIPVIQIMQGGATDAIPWRNAGIPAYGISGLMVDPDDLRLHGRDERVPVKSFFDARRGQALQDMTLRAGQLTREPMQERRHNRGGMHGQSPS